MTEATKRDEVAELDQEIQELETEAAAPPDLSWDEIVGLTAEELTQREQRKGILGKMIQARKAKRLQPEADLLKEELEDERLQKAKERRDQAWSTWQIQQGVFINIEQRLRRTEKRLKQIEEAVV